MAVAPSPPPPHPPPARIIVAVLEFVRFILAPVLGLVRVVRVAARALPYLCFAAAWVISAGSAATIVARHACREGSAPLVFLEAFTDAAFKFSICVIFIFLALAAVLLFGLCLVAVVSGSGSKVKKSAFGAIRQGSTRGLSRLPRAVVLGLVADLPFILLIVVGLLVVMMMSSPVGGGGGSISQGEMIGTMIAEVGIFGFHAISCFVIIPALALDVWRDDRSDTKLGLGVADC